MRPSDKRSYSGNKLREGEGFGEIVVCSETKTLDPVVN
jgi:hypothetical protein